MKTPLVSLNFRTHLAYIIIIMLMIYPAELLAAGKMLPSCKKYLFSDPTPGSDGVNEYVRDSVPPDEIPEERIEFRLGPSSDIYRIPCKYNKDPDAINNDINRAVIVIHGTLRNAVSYYNDMESAAELAGNALDSMMILAPQFLAQVDDSSYNFTNDILYWSKGGWKIGHKSKNPNPGDTLSSFAAIDTILNRLTDGRNKNLQDIVIAGHSAGGQFVNRYAAGCRMVETVKNRGITLRFVVMNPSSYLYLDDLRYDENDSTWKVPSSDCSLDPPYYNRYKYGLDTLNTYMGSGNNNGRTNIRNNYRTRRVIYLLGEDDNDPDDSSLDKSCAAMTQGDHRLIRGLRYFTHLSNFYSARGETVYHEYAIIPNVEHDHEDMFESDLGLYSLFDYRTNCLSQQSCVYHMVQGFIVKEDDVTGQWYNNIQEAIDKAITNGENNWCIQLMDGTFTGSGNIDIDFKGKDYALISWSNDPDKCIIDCESNGRGFIFSTGETSNAELVGIKVINGDQTDGGAVYVNNASPTISECGFENNDAADGGALYFNNSSSQISHLLINGNTTVESGGGIFCNAGANITLNRVNVSGNSAGNDGGGIYCDASSPTLSNCRISDNDAAKAGGGMFCANASNPHLKNVIIKENNCTHEGGGLYCKGTSKPVFYTGSRSNIFSNQGLIGVDIFSEQNLTVIVDTFTVKNTSSYYALPHENFTFNILNQKSQTYSADLYVDPVSGDNSNNGQSPGNALKTIRKALSLIHADHSNQHTIHLADGIYAAATNGETFPVVPLSNVTVSGNGDSLCFLDGALQQRVVYFNRVNNSGIQNLTVKKGFDEYGAGMYIRQSNPLLDGICISDSKANINGGGLLLDNSDAVIKNSTITNNQTTSGYGGGLYVEASDPQINNVTIAENNADDNGGGIMLKNSSPTMLMVEINNNTSQESGGGMFCADNSNVVMDSVWVVGNYAKTDGGGLSLYDSEPELKHTVLVNNETDQSGGAIYAASSSPYAENITISKNSAAAGGGAIKSVSSTFNIKNSILWGDSLPEISGTVNATYCDIQGGYNGTGTGNITSNPQFHATSGDSAYYLTATSPCLDAGDPASSLDPDGSQRDMGAFYYYHDEVIFPPKADFEADITSGDAPLTVNFINKSSNGTADIKEWSWDFGDGNTLTDTIFRDTVHHTYTLPDTCSVSLTVSDGDSTDYKVINDYIEVLPVGPSASFTADKTYWYGPLTVTFTDESTSGTGEITGWEWDFGDGTDTTYSTLAQTITHTYDSVGIYSVSLGIQDEYNNGAQIIRVNLITVLKGTYINGGYVSGNWDKEDDPFVIGGDIEVHSDSMLTIDTGVYVIFKGHYKFEIFGRLNAAGNASEMVLFTPENHYPGWAGLRFINNDGNNQGGSELSWCKIEYGFATSDSKDESEKNGGGIYLDNSSEVSISNTSIQNCRADSAGGGIYCNQSNPYLSEVLIESNIAKYGGGMYLDYSSPNLTTVDIWENEAEHGGGIYLADYCTPALEGVSIKSNQALSIGGGKGGGIFLGNSFPQLLNVVFHFNSAGMGGALYFSAGSMPEIGNISIYGNSAGKGGGIFFNQSGFTELSGLEINNNSAGEGGGIYYHQSNLPALNGLILQENYSTGPETIVGGMGGGIYFYYSDPSLENVTLIENAVYGPSCAGGGIYCDNSNPQLEYVYFDGNIACDSVDNFPISPPNPLGGGLCCYNSSPVLSRVIFSNNTASDFIDNVSGFGGGMYCSGASSTPSLTNVTFSANFAGMAGGAVSADNNSAPNIKNSIAWNDTQPEFNEQGGGLITVDFSDIEGGWTGAGAGNTILNSDPLFADPLSGDYHLSWTNAPVLDATKSPCIDAGDPVSPIDPDGTISDMGALFFDQSVLPPKADFNSDVNSGIVPLTVNFADLSVSSINPITKWRWYFGDTYTDTVQHPTHTYQNPGTYNVSLWVEDNAGKSDLITKAHFVTASAYYDYGDAPDEPYSTLFASDGARHIVDPAIYLGDLIDEETDGIPTNTARGDDDDNLDDEDGVRFIEPFVAGETAMVKVDVSADGYLNAWIDLNINGAWESFEHVIPDQAVVAGQNIFSFNIPGSSKPGRTFARFRYSTTGGLATTGLAQDGEVEDYMLTIYPPGWDFTLTGSSHLVSVPAYVLLNEAVKGIEANKISQFELAQEQECNSG